MFANRLIKTLATKPEKLIIFNTDKLSITPDMLKRDYRDFNRIQTEAHGETVEYFLHMLTGDGSHLRSGDPSPLRECQFFDFGYIGNETIKTESLTVVEAFYEGFARLPAATCFMEHQWAVNDGRDKVASGYLFLQGSDDGKSAGNNEKIVCLEIRNFAEDPSLFFWDGISLALHQERSSGEGYDCDVLNNLYNTHFSGANWFDPLMTMLGRLNAVGMEKNYSPAPPKLNAQRRKKGLPGVVGHTVVKIAPYRAAMGHSGQRDGEEYTPKRYHFRRGHIRHFQNGQKSWVRPCFVGTPEDGSVEHEYIVD